MVISRSRSDDASAETIEIALSSEHPVERYDWWTEQRYTETLNHDKDSIDLSRAKDGLPLLLDHSTYEQVGILENVRLDDDKVLRAEARFSRSAKGQEIAQDVTDGIRKTVSIGYQVNTWEKKESTKRGEVAKWRATSWTPMEGSLVAIPSDPTVGVGRSADGAALSVHVPPVTQAAPKAEGVRMSETTNAATAENGAAPAVRVTADHQGDQRARELVALGREHAMLERAVEWVTDGTSIESARREVMATLSQRIKDGPKFAPRVELSDKDHKEYSFVRAINSAMEGTNSFEREISESIAKNLPAGYRAQGTGFFIPTHVRNRVPSNVTGEQLMTRANLYNASTVGAETVFTEEGSFIDLLRNKARILQAGATMLGGLTSPVSMPKQTGSMTAYWVGENPTAGVTQSDAAFGSVTLSPKTLMATTKYSKQLARQSSLDVETFIRNDIARVYALALDLAGLAGTGASNQPTGVLTNTSVNSFTLGANGAVMSFANFVQMEKEIEDDNANTGTMAYITTPGVRYKAKTTQTFTSTGDPIWTGGEEGLVNGYRAFSTKQVPSNLTTGTSTTICSAVLFGAWANLHIGEWGALELTVDPYTEAAKGNIVVTSFAMADVALRYPEAFCRVVQALTT